LQVLVLKHISSGEMTMIFTAIPLWTCVLSFLIVSEHFTTNTAAGGALIFIGCLLRFKATPSRGGSQKMIPNEEQLCPAAEIVTII
jgi:drug/metabolite transporter (DMT)-like permease